MKREFKIDSHIAIMCDDYYYDLHNCYDLKGLELDSSKQQLAINFVKLEGEWVKHEDPQRIEILFNGLKYFEVSKGFFLKTSYSLEELGFKNIEDRDYSWLLSEEQSTGSDHLFIRLENDEYIRVLSDTVEVNKIEPAPIRYI